MRPRLTIAVLSLLSLPALQACAELNRLGALVQPPHFEQAPGQRAEIRLLGPTGGRPLGGAGVRLWTKVTNPNAFALTLGTLNGTLYLEESRAADAEFPLGLPLAARQETVIPIDISVSFSDLPGLGDAARRATSRQPLAYRLDGTIGVDAGPLGQPVFGPMTLVRGEAAVPGISSFSGGLRPPAPLHTRSRGPVGPRSARVARRASLPRPSRPDRGEQASRALAIGPVRMQPRMMGFRAQP